MRFRNVSGIKLAGLLAATVVCAPAVLQAQEADSALGTDLETGTRLHTALEAGASYTDNFFYARNTSNNESGSGLIVRPDIALTRVVPRFKFSGSAGGEFAWFDLQGDVDDYIDSDLGLTSDWQSAARHRFSFAATLRNDHDPFGTERTENTPLADRELDRWRRSETTASYHYGLPSDRFNVELRVGGFNKEYRNNRDITQFLDHEVAKAQLFGFLNLGPKSSVYATVGSQRSYYEEVALGAFDRGATTLRYLMGARWLATAKTSGDVQVGYVRRDPRDTRRDEFARFDWLAQVMWSPRTVREFTLLTGRRAQESYLNTVDFIDIRYVELGWSEQWAPRFKTQFDARYFESDFVGSSPGRVDNVVRYSLGANYRISRELQALATVSHGQRDSDVAFANYDRLYAYIGMRYAR